MVFTALDCYSCHILFAQALKLEMKSKAEFHLVGYNPFKRSIDTTVKSSPLFVTKFPRFQYGWLYLVQKGRVSTRTGKHGKREKWESTFQLGKRRNLIRLEESGNFTQNTGKVMRIWTIFVLGEKLYWRNCQPEKWNHQDGSMKCVIYNRNPQWWNINNTGKMEEILEKSGEFVSPKSGEL